MWLATLALVMTAAQDVQIDSPADGVTVSVAGTFQPDRPVVRVTGAEGDERLALPGSRLHLAPVDPEAWLDGEPVLATRDTMWGPRRMLVLDVVGVGPRRVDLEGGRVWFDTPPRAHHAPVVADHRRDETQALYVEEVTLPAGGIEGEPVEVLVEGTLPNPGWSFAGFELAGERGDDGMLELSVRALGLPPNDGMLRPQVLAPFAQTLRLSGLEAGAYRLRFVGRAADVALQRLEILRADPIVTMRRSGGFAGVNETVALYSDGWIEWSDRLGGPRAGAAALEQEDFERARTLLAALPAQTRVEQDGAMVDGFEHSLFFPRGGVMWQRTLFGAEQEGGERELVELLSKF